MISTIGAGIVFFVVDKVLEKDKKSRQAPRRHTALQRIVNFIDEVDKLFVRMAHDSSPERWKELQDVEELYTESMANQISSLNLYAKAPVGPEGISWREYLLFKLDQMEKRANSLAIKYHFYLPDGICARIEDDLGRHVLAFTKDLIDLRTELRKSQERSQYLTLNIPNIMRMNFEKIREFIRDIEAYIDQEGLEDIKIPCPRFTKEQIPKSVNLNELEK